MVSRRAPRILLDVLRGVISIGIVAAGITFLASHATQSAPFLDPAGLTAVRPPERSAGSRDTLALLRRDEPAPPDPFTTLLQAVSPVSLLTGALLEGRESLNSTFQRLASTPSVMPTQGWLVSNFTRRRLHPLLGYVRPHLGIDVRAPRGTAVEAPAAGTVVYAGWEGSYGWTVDIDHGWGIVTRYAHTSKMFVRPGERVQRGDVIALVGSTGLAEGPHLHYEVRVNGLPVDPLRFVLPAVIAD